MRSELVALSPIHGGRSRHSRPGSACVEGLRLASPAPFPVVHRVHVRTNDCLAGLRSLAPLLACNRRRAAGLRLAGSSLRCSGKPVLAWPAFAIVCFDSPCSARARQLCGAGRTGRARAQGRPRKAKEAVVSDRLALVVPIQGRTSDATQAIRQALAGAEELLP